MARTPAQRRQAVIARLQSTECPDDASSPSRTFACRSSAAWCKGGGGASLTPLGKEVLRRYRAMERRALKAISKDVVLLESLIRD
jgi:hypothetical protein